MSAMDTVRSMFQNDVALATRDVAMLLGAPGDYPSPRLHRRAACVLAHLRRIGEVVSVRRDGWHPSDPAVVLWARSEQEPTS